MLLDTSGLLTFIDDANDQHLTAHALMQRAQTRLTHSYVLAELIPLTRTRRVFRREVLNFVVELIEDPEINVVWVTEADHLAAVSLLRSRPDKQYSLCDAVSFVLMRRFNLTDALTTDHHFEQEGFVRLVRP